MSLSLLIFPLCDSTDMLGTYRPEMSMALRLRLNETVEELEKLRETNLELDLKVESQANELTVAKSDCEWFCRVSLYFFTVTDLIVFETVNLVSKDQTDILKSLRASVSVEKEGLVQEVGRLKESLKVMEDRAKMQMNQVSFPFQCQHFGSLTKFGLV